MTPHDGTSPPAWQEAVGGSAPYDVQHCAPRAGREFVRYLIVGTLAFLIDLATLAGMTEWLQVNYLIANVCGFCLAVSFSYTLCISWVFGTRRLQCAVTEFGIFAGVALLGLLVNELSMWALVGGGGLHYALAKVVATGLVFMLNFALRKRLLFR